MAVRGSEFLYLSRRKGHYMHLRPLRLAALSPILALVMAQAASADVLASDNYSSLTVGALAGQTVGGYGFTGTWTQPGSLTSGLSYVGSNLIGRPFNNGENAGDNATFAGGGFLLNSGQVFLSIDMNSSDSSVRSTRLDFITSTGVDYLGGIGPTNEMHFYVDGINLASGNIDLPGNNLMVGVLDFANDKIALFVNPTSSSYYLANGSNDATAVAAWTAPASTTALSYNLVENYDNTATYSNFKLTTDFASAAGLTASTPEPGAAGLMIGAGLTGLGLVIRRRRNIS